MQNNNPYTAPNANVTDMSLDETKFGKVSITNTKGRIGRLRFLLYTFGLSFLGAGLAAALILIPSVGPILAGITYILIFVFSIFLAIQRCHDFNAIGWWSLIMLIPLVSLVFYFIPGTKGSNRFGYQPPPNSKAEKIGVFLIIGVFVLGILAMLLIPLFDGNIAQQNALLPE